MKAVVLEIKENKAAVLDDKGIVHAVKNKGYEVGQKLEVTEFELKRDEIKSLNTSKITRFTRTAAAVLAVAIIGGGVTAYAAPVSTVTVGGASSVEYKLNLFDRVLDISASEDDDDTFKEEISELSREVRGMKISDAIDMTASRFNDELFEAGDDGKVPEITVRVGGLKRNDKHLSDELDNKASEINSHRPRDVEMDNEDAADTEIPEKPEDSETLNGSNGNGIVQNDASDNTKPEDAGRPDDEKRDMPTDDTGDTDGNEIKQDPANENSGNKPDDAGTSKPEDNGQSGMTKPDDNGQNDNSGVPSDLPQNIGNMQNDVTQSPSMDTGAGDAGQTGGVENHEPPQDAPHEDHGGPGDGGNGAGDKGHGGPH